MQGQILKIVQKVKRYAVNAIVLKVRNRFFRVKEAVERKRLLFILRVQVIYILLNSGGIHPELIEPASPKEEHGDAS